MPKIKDSEIKKLSTRKQNFEAFLKKAGQPKPAPRKP